MFGQHHQLHPEMRNLAQSGNKTLKLVVVKKDLLQTARLLGSRKGIQPVKDLKLAMLI